MVAFGVLPAIGLDDQPPLEADEIDNVGIDHELSTKLEHGHPAVAQHRPEAAFGVGWVRTHLSGAITQ